MIAGVSADLGKESEITRLDQTDSLLEDRPPDWMTFLTKHCGLYIPGVYVSNPYNDSRPLTAIAIGWKLERRR